ncbi:hypothetical protein BJ742DRAFT_819665 [Cladochytrium replicatum]|nr:hypothetical protein BJ742DRAFT_819665 [Cladochytrium replicatum]
MFSFEGNFKQKRQINLSGKKERHGKDDLLKKAQQERQQREAERVRLKSAIRIQSFWRGRRVTARAREQERALWDEIYSVEVENAFQSAESSGDQDIGSALSRAIRSLLFFFRRTRDYQRFETLCGYLLREEKSTGLPYIIANVKRFSSQSEWWAIVHKVTRLALPLMLVNDGLDKETQEDVNTFVTVVQSVSDMTSYLKLAAQLPDFDGVRSFSDNMKYLLDNGFYAWIRNLILAVPIERKKIPSIYAMLDLATRPFLSVPVATIGSPVMSSSPRRSDALNSVQFENAISHFATEIFTIPLLANRASLETLTAIIPRLPLDRLVLKLGRRDNQDLYDRIAGLGTGYFGGVYTNSFVASLANLLAFGQRVYARPQNTSLRYYISAQQMLLSKIPVNTFEKVELSTSVAIYNDEDDDDDGDSSRQLGANELPATPMDERLLKWLSSALETNHISVIARPLRAVGNMSSTAMQIDGELDEISVACSACTLLYTWMVRWPAKRKDIMDTLLFKTVVADGSTVGSPVAVVKALMTLSMRTGLGFAGKLKPESFTDPRFSEDWCTTALFAETFSWWLFTTSDDEFFDNKALPGGPTRSNKLDLNDVIRISSLLRDGTFLLHWNTTLQGMQDFELQNTGLRVRDLKQLFTKVLSQIHARDSRRPFCPSGHWLMTDEIHDLDSFAQSAVVEDDPNAVSSLPSPFNVFEAGVHSNVPSSSPIGRVPRASLANRVVGTHSSNRRINHLGPRQAVLNNIPFVIPFETRVKIFREFIRLDRIRNGLDESWAVPVARVTIRRNHVFEDGYAYLNALGPNLKNRIAITFVSDHGMVEAGIDGGGVFKEFLTSITRQAFDVKYGLFQNTKDNLLYPSSNELSTEEQYLRYFEFLGRILGKALYEGILVDAGFASFFLAKWLGRQSYLDDLPSLDLELYQGLVFLKNYTGDVEADLSLTFTVDDQEFGKNKTVELIPNGSQTAVTKDNRIHYIYRVANYRLNTQIDKQCKAFFKGLSDMIDPKWLKMFNPQELQILIGGTNTTIDLEDLQRNTQYGGGFDDDHPAVIRFWRVVHSLSEEEKRSLVKFVTSCSRPPLMGFSELNPQFCLRNAGSTDLDRLPTASTCVNLLKMPPYETEEIMKEKLLYAINAGAGFDLS